MSGVVSKGATNVSQLTFTIDDPLTLENEARVEAIKRAEAKAETIARAGHFRVGRLLSIDEGGGFPIPYAKYGRATLEADTAVSSLPPPTIEPGSQEVRINITLRYEIK